MCLYCKSEWTDNFSLHRSHCHIHFQFVHQTQKIVRFHIEPPLHGNETVAMDGEKPIFSSIRMIICVSNYYSLFLSTIYSLTIGIFSMETNKLIFVSAKHYRIHHTNGRYFSLTDSGMLSFTRHANVFNEFMRCINIYLKGIREKSVVKSVRVFFASFLALRDIRNDCFFCQHFPSTLMLFPSSVFNSAYGIVILPSLLHKRMKQLVHEEQCSCLAVEVDASTIFTAIMLIQSFFFVVGFVSLLFDGTTESQAMTDWNDKKANLTNKQIDYKSHRAFKMTLVAWNKHDVQPITVRQWNL